MWQAGAKKRISFLVDRDILADQTKTNDFKLFGQAMTKITNRTVDKAFDMYRSLYQADTGIEEEQNIYKQFSPEFFALVAVDERHRGSAAEDANRRKVLEYFSSATQISMTVTPKETSDVSNIEYFGDPIRTDSLSRKSRKSLTAPSSTSRTRRRSLASTALAMRRARAVQWRTSDERSCVTCQLRFHLSPNNAGSWRRWTN